MGARCLKTAVQGARDNVVINLKDIKDEPFKLATLAEVDRLVESARLNCRKVLDVLDSRSQ